MPDKIKVVDLFAGPGGLGEGFATFRGSRNSRPFDIAMSVEKESSAHKTLELRAFLRKFPSFPDAYYQYLKGAISREALLTRFPAKANAARVETLFGPCELGNEAGDDRVFSQLKELLKKHDSPWVVLGGPPCQAYSLVGRSRNQGTVGYRAEKDSRHFLYQEYLKVLAKVRPAVFVMENVKGILSSKVSGQPIFPRLLDDLRRPEKAIRGRSVSGLRYRIYSMANGTEIEGAAGTGADCIIRCEDFGVPQARHRVILLGVAEDIKQPESVLTRSNIKPTIDSMIRGLPDLRSGLSKESDSPEKWHAAIERAAARVTKEFNRSRWSAAGIKKARARSARLNNRGGRFVLGNGTWSGPDHLKGWIYDNRIGGYINHETRGHIEEDLARYLFCASYAAQSEGKSPKSQDFPESLAPDHASWETGNFADRFRVQSAGRPASTITSHIAKDGHYFIHYDPAQCRSLTVREAARLQTFPDNYFFEGNRTQQYVQVGNAVPPWLANQIAQIVYSLVR